MMRWLRTKLRETQILFFVERWRSKPQGVGAVSQRNERICTNSCSENRRRFTCLGDGASKLKAAKRESGVGWRCERCGMGSLVGMKCCFRQTAWTVTRSRIRNHRGKLPQLILADRVFDVAIVAGYREKTMDVAIEYFPASDFSDIVDGGRVLKIPARIGRDEGIEIGVMPVLP